MAIQSWQAAVPHCQIILMGDPAGSREVVKELGITQCLSVLVNKYATPLVNSIFELSEKYAAQQWICNINSDIVLDVDVVNTIAELADFSYPFVIGQRWDIDQDAHPSTAVLHPSCGIDYFLYRRNTIPVDQIPPFAVGKTAYDNWLVWAAITNWGMSVIDATEDITALHVNHPHLEYGDKSTMLNSEERQENLRLFAEHGGQRFYNVDDAPWVLVNGEVRQREAVV
jgi:hypothetical protein